MPTPAPCPAASTPGACPVSTVCGRRRTANNAVNMFRTAAAALIAASLLIVAADFSLAAGEVPTAGMKSAATALLPAQELAALRAGAAKGDPKAEYRLGQALLDGKLTKPDYPKALSLFQKSAGQGYLPAMIAAGDMYFKGLEIAPDYQKAAAWYQKAAAKGAAESHYNLGTMYDQGLGVQRNLIQSYRHYQAAAKAKYKDADDKLADLVQRMTPAQLAKVKRR